MAVHANKSALVKQWRNEQHDRNKGNDSFCGDASSSFRATRSQRSSSRPDSYSRHAHSAGTLSARTAHSARTIYDGSADLISSGECKPALSKGIVNAKNINVDLGKSALSTVRGIEMSKDMPPWLVSGKMSVACKIVLHKLHVESHPSMDILQYDVQVIAGTD